MRFYQPQYTHRSFTPHQSWWKRLKKYFYQERRYKTKAFADADVVYSRHPWKREVKELHFFNFKIKLLLLTLFILGWSALLFYLPAFNIQRISFSGLRTIELNEIESFIKSNFLNCKRIFPCRNYFVISADSVKRSLMSAYSLNAVSVEKKFPGDLTVDIEEKISALIYDNFEGYYLMDSSGSIAKRLDDVRPNEIKIAAGPIATSSFMMAATSTASSSVSIIATSTIATIATSTMIHTPAFRRISRSFGEFPIFYDKRAILVEEGRKRDVLKPELVQSILDWQKAIKEQGIGELQYFSMETPLQGLRVHLDKAWDLIIDPNADLSAQINNLKLILASNKPQQYIDLRYGERVYWR